MAQNDTATDVAQAARELNEIEDELRDVHGPPVVETRDLLVFADEHGHELNEIAKHTDGITRSEVSEWMHTQARKVYGREQSKGAGDPWSVSDPIVVLKD